jgi:hypothetical protein
VLRQRNQGTSSGTGFPTEIRTFRYIYCPHARSHACASSEHSIERILVSFQGCIHTPSTRNMA